MPTYEYRRKDGSVFEYRQGINDEPLKVCPETGQEVTRIISGGGGVVYKGDGWYVTDYKNSRTNSPGSGSNSGKKPESSEQESTAEKKEGDTSGKEDKTKET